MLHLIKIPDTTYNYKSITSKNINLNIYLNLVKEPKVIASLFLQNIFVISYELLLSDTYSLKFII